MPLHFFSNPVRCAFPLCLPWMSQSKKKKSLQQGCTENWDSHAGAAFTCCHIVLSPSSRAECPLRPELLIVFHSAALRGRDPTAPRAEDHYVVWHRRACQTIHSPQWCSWVNWFLALRSTFRLEHRGEKRHWMQRGSLWHTFHETGFPIIYIYKTVQSIMAG